MPKAARILADWGADVIKIEPPKGEAMRYMGLSWDIPCEKDNNPLFQSENAGKKSLALNLKDPQGLEVMHKLLKNADVFISNTRKKG